MARIKKKGLDYFPLNTDFIHDRAVRRLMKREGDSALGILVEILSYIYAGEGYYVRADRLFYEDLSAGLYEKSADDVERIVRLAVEYGLFDAVLFERSCILTSVEIQRQYLFSTRRRSISHLEAGYCLLADDEPADNKVDMKEQPAFGSEETEGGKSVSVGDNVTFIPENVTSGTHSIAQHSVAENRVEYPLSTSPGKDREVREEKEESFSIRELSEQGKNGMLQPKGPVCESVAVARIDTSRLSKRREWTNEAIDGLQPPADGMERNYTGLLYNLRLYGISPSEQYAIIRKSNFGVIGNPVWKGLGTLRDSGGKIKLPGRYLLSVLNN